MCSCEGAFVCARCSGTPFDPRYEEDAAEPVTVEEFEQMSRDPFSEIWQGWA